MIILGKDKVDKRYNIDDNGIITDLQGNVQELDFQQGRFRFKGVPLHQIVMYTKFEYRNGNEWEIHHKDGDKLNNKISNLQYLTPSEHTRLHHKGKKAKLWNKGKYDIYSDETKKKMSESHKGKHWKKDPITGKRIWF